jgi:cobalt transporter subunit CbtA
MLFRNIIITAFFSAIIAGILLGIMQSYATSPIIYSAEKYEVTEAPAAHAHSPASTSAHSHAASTWEPASTTERVAYTYLADILIAFGHSLLLTSFMLLLWLKFEKPEISWRSGLIIGLGGYISFYLATVIGLPPEVPGSIGADLHARQLWWTLTIMASILGLSILYLASNSFKVIGIAFLLLPHLIGAPHPEVQGFVNSDTAAISALSQLEHQFLISTAWVNLVYWLVLGLISGLFAHKLLTNQL